MSAVGGLDMELDGSGSENSGNLGNWKGKSVEKIRVRKKTLLAVVEQCQRTLELLKNTENLDEIDLEEDGGDDASSPSGADLETAELCDLLKSRVESPNFLEKLDSVHMSSLPNVSEEISSWDVISETDVWEGGYTERSNEEDYVVVRQEDIVEGLACFMAAYLLSLKETKELNPSEIQKVLSRTFSTKKKRGKLQRAWNGTQAIYNVASWGATAIGFYQNPALCRAASVAFWSSCRFISKLL